VSHLSLGRLAKQMYFPLYKPVKSVVKTLQLLVAGTLACRVGRIRHPQAVVDGFMFASAVLVGYG